MKAYYQGREVFVKEVRVLSGFTTRSSDGVSSLKQESKVLEELKGLDGVPSKCEMINGEKSSFLITDYFNGKSLRAYVTETCPLVLGTEEKRIHTSFGRNLAWKRLEPYLLGCMISAGVTVTFHLTTFWFL